MPTLYNQASKVRGRRRMHLPREAAALVVEGDRAMVTVQKPDSVKALLKMGWSLVELPAVKPAAKPAPKPEPVPVEVQVEDEPMSRRDELFGMTVKELRAIAREHDIRGRSTMSEKQLVDAIIEVE